MCIDTLTPEQFMRLDPADHATAIQVYSQRITLTEKKLRLLPGPEATELLLDETRRCQNLRKIHVHAMHEQLFGQAVATDGATALAA